MKNTSTEPKRETVLTCRVDGRAVTLEQLAVELVRCGGIARKGAK